MPRLKAIEIDQAEGKAKQLLEDVKSKLGMAPNIMRTMVNSPAALEAYLMFSGTLQKGVLSGKIRERLALSIGESNGCDYCVAAHTALGKAAGLSDEEILDSRRGSAPDSNVESLLKFANQIVEKRGSVSDDDISEVRKAGYGDAEIAEVVANVALNIYTNYFNHVAQTEVDFPAAPPLK